MGLVKRDLTGRTWVRMPADTSPLAKRHTPYAPAQDQITVTVTTSTATQVFVARKTTSILKGVDFSAKRIDQAVIDFDTLASFVRDSYRPRRARARARQAAAEAVNQQAAKEAADAALQAALPAPSVKKRSKKAAR